MRKMQLSPRYIVLVCVFLLSSCLLAVGNVAGKCAQSSSQSSVPAQLAIEAYEREDFGESVKYFNEAVRSNHVSDIISGRSIGTHGRADRYASMPHQLRGDKSDAPDVGIAIFLAESQVACQSLADDIAIQPLDAYTARL